MSNVTYLWKTSNRDSWMAQRENVCYKREAQVEIMQKMFDFL